MPWAFTLILTAVAATEVPTSIDELVSHYEQIFKTGNRNAASHLWSSYILDRAAQLEAKTLETLFRGFCPVSGSPLPDQPQTRFYSTLSSVTGEKVSGITHHCCWPCICDTQSAVKTDTKEIQTASGAKSYTFLVIGDPCANSAKLLEGYKDPFTGSQVTLQEQAPEVTCVDNRLSGAHFSSRGHVIIGMYFVGDAEKEALPFNDASTFKDKCEARKEHGFGSGMGAIFQKVAAINPIVSPSFLQKWDAPTGSVDNQRLELALINIFGVVGAVGAALLIIMLARRQPKLNAGSDSEVE